MTFIGSLSAVALRNRKGQASQDVNRKGQASQDVIVENKHAESKFKVVDGAPFNDCMKYLLADHCATNAASIAKADEESMCTKPGKKDKMLSKFEMFCQAYAARSPQPVEQTDDQKQAAIANILNNIQAVPIVSLSDKLFTWNVASGRLSSDLSPVDIKTRADIETNVEYAAYKEIQNVCILKVIEVCEKERTRELKSVTDRVNTNCLTLLKGTRYFTKDLKGDSAELMASISRNQYLNQYIFG
jgi:hypothetical protein